MASSKKNRINLAFIYDDLSKFKKQTSYHFPKDATGEWESEDTLALMIETWKKLDCHVSLLPFNEVFFEHWNKNYKSFDAVHSVLEGWGSLSREAWVSSFCEMSGVPYIGSQPFAHNISMKKSAVKIIANFLDIPTAEFHVIRKEEDLEKIPKDFFNQTHFIKPDCEGSGIGINHLHSISDSHNKTIKNVTTLLKDFPEGVLLEKHLPGLELTSALLGYDLNFLPIAQIEVPDGVYGLEHKSKNYMGEKVTFPKLDKKTTRIIKDGSIKISKYIHVQDFVRIDWRMDEKNNVQLLEVNTLAGLSHIYSVLPMMANESGINYVELFRLLLESALKRKNGREFRYSKSQLR